MRPLEALRLEDHFADLDVDQRHHAADRSCIELTEPLEASVVAVAQMVEFTIPKRTSLPSILRVKV